MEEELQETSNTPESAGRGTDTVLAHMSLGEIVIPRAVQDDPEVQQMLQAIFEKAGANINEFTVGDQANKINPETGYPEFGFGSFLKKAFKIAAPLALSYFGAPAVLGSTTLGGALAGGGIGALTGGGLGGALQGAALGGLAPNLKDIGSYASGALKDFGNASGLSDAYNTASGALGNAYRGISDAIGGAYNGSALQDVYSSGSNALKSITGLGESTSNIGSAPQITGGGGSSYSGGSGSIATDFGNQSRDILNNAGTGGLTSSLASNPSILNTGADVAKSSNSFLSPAVSALLGTYSNNKAEDALLSQQRNNQALLSPYLNFKFDSTDLQNDPGYQFNLSQGNQALDRQQLAKGGYFSGNALKEAQTFGQGLADNTYNTAFNRALQTNGAGLQGALSMAGINDNIGNIKANSVTNTGNLYSGALGSILPGNSFDNTGALQGGAGNDILTQLLRLQQKQGSIYGS